MNYFEKLYAIDVSKKIEKKNNLSYLSWAYAWAELKKIHPYANYKVFERPDGVNYFTDGRTCWVKVSVSIPFFDEDGHEEGCSEHIEMLPIMDFRNNSIPLDKVTSYEVNKTIQRALTKAIARHGIGLYIYAGEDLPEEPAPQIFCKCGKPIKAGGGYTAQQVADARAKKYGEPLCDVCAAEKRKQMEEANNAITEAFNNLQEVQTNG